MARAVGAPEEFDGAAQGLFLDGKQVYASFVGFAAHGATGQDRRFHPLHHGVLDRFGIVEFGNDEGQDVVATEDLVCPCAGGAAARLGENLSVI